MRIIKFISLLGIVFLSFIGCDNPVAKTDIVQANFYDPEKGVYNNAAHLELLLDYYKTSGKEEQFFESIPITEGLTYTDIQPHFEEHCNSCHFSGGIAPFAFDSPQNIRKRAKPILESLETLTMPPWLAENSYSEFCNEQTMSDEVRSRMISWLRNGAEIGEEFIENTPSKDYHRDSSVYVIQSPAAHTITTDSNSYACFVFEPNLEQDTFVTSINFKSSNFNVVHHLTLFVDTSGVLDSKPDCWVCTRDGTARDLVLIEPWTKGYRKVQFTEGFGYRLPKNSKFLLQAHYENYHKGEEESTQIELSFCDKPQNEVKWTLLNNFDIHFKANTVSAESLTYTVTEPTTILGLYPHLHFICKTLEVFAATPYGEKKRILFIPQWDYMLQAKYVLKHPVSLPVGSTLYANAVFDNTSGNPVQPNNPLRDVIYDISEHDEMFTITLFHTDSNQSEYNKCVAEISD